MVGRGDKVKYTHSGDNKVDEPSVYAGLFEAHPWFAHFLVYVVKRVLGVIISWIDKEAKPLIDKG